MTIVRAEHLQAGDRIDDKYEVRAVLGMGGMGVVVEAIHLDLQERVALKFLLAEAGGHEDTVARFLREARTVRKLKSEHIVKVIDVGRRGGSGEPYIAMELLLGRDLSVELAECGTLPVQTACTFVLQACDALAEAHANRIIHRDIKPANLFLTYPAGGGRPCIKVLDFGIAKVIEAEGKGTQTKAMMGSALYMSPEQMRSSKTVDARADVWALGVTLYELLTGHTPFTADSIPEIILAITSEPPTPPRVYRPDLPPALEALLLRCLEKDVAARIPTVAALAAELAAFADHESSGLARAIQARGLSLDTTQSQPLFGEKAALAAPAIAPASQASTRLDLTVTNSKPSRPDRGRTIAVATLLLGAGMAASFFGARVSTKPPASHPDTPMLAFSPAPSALAAEPTASTSVSIPPAITLAAPAAPSGSGASLGTPHTAFKVPASKPLSKDARPAATPSPATATAPKNGHLGTSVD